MVASSQKGRWSFDSEYLGSGHHKLSGTSSRFSYSPSMDLQACMGCSKLLTERSAWCSAGNNISVVSVLACGHVFHAECLETMTAKEDSYDPVCLVCTAGEKNLLKLSKKGLRDPSGADLSPRMILPGRRAFGRDIVKIEFPWPYQLVAAAL
uniref:RING-type domain-containing protein n=1 Tax=Lotus japonicus TaxID=34305 RepID=I3SB92_LOTJA|nr:unknown [Lotus japonicus]